MSSVSASTPDGSLDSLRPDRFAAGSGALAAERPGAAWPLWLAGGGLALGVLTVAWLVARGPRGLLYLLAYVLATAPGWPIGWRLFGRAHAAAWITGALIGYALSAWIVWLSVPLQADSRAERLALWIAIAGIIWLWWGLSGRTRPAAVTLPAWTRRDTVALLLLLWLVPLLVGPPFRHVGAQDEQGNRYYRAYFTADVLWHVALTAELTRFTLPPKNPYAADKTLHYYWTYFLVPTAIIASAPHTFGDDYAPWLLINATGAGLLFVAMIAVAAWCAVPRRWPVMIAVALALVAASAEGAYVLWDAISLGVPIASMRGHNIDAATRFLFDGLAIDGLPRSLWYTPQHAAACAYGLIALLLAGAQSLRGAARADDRGRRWAIGGAWLPILAAGIALAASVTFSPLLGGMFALIYGLAIIARALVLGEWRALPIIVLRQLGAILPVLLAIAALFRWSMIEGAGGALHIGFHGFARNAPIATLLLSIGPVFLLGVIGLWWWRRAASALVVPIVGVGVGLALFYFASLPSVDPVWIGWRAGQIMLVCLPALAAHAIASLADAGRTGRLVAAVCVVCAALVGLPTTAIDAYNAQDIDNREMGAGFHWTVLLTPAQQEAAAWIRRNTHPAAVVQMEPTVRGRETWTLIPTFAHRRMHAGLPISLLAEDDYALRSRRMRTAYGIPDGPYAWKMFRLASVDYIYIDSAERAAFSAESLGKFDTNPDLFRLVFKNAEVSLYRVVH